MGLSIQHQKKPSCEIWYGSVNNLKFNSKKGKKKKQFETLIVGLSTHHKKKLDCEIVYESINKIGEHPFFPGQTTDSKKNNEKKIEKPNLELSIHHPKKTLMQNLV